MLNFLRKITPKLLIKAYHYLLALAADFFYRHPSDKLIVIGVTGTSGKSSVVYLVSRILEKAGFKVGAASTILFKVNKKEWLNDKKMTMIGRFALQRLIKRMVKANCQYAVIETTSQGIEQFRHLGINYDVLVFTNLYPEHIEAHGSFENYKNAKLKLFRGLKKESSKLIAGQKIKKIIIANLDDEHADDFLNNWAEEKIGFTLGDKIINQGQTVKAEKVSVGADGSGFNINGCSFELKLLGRHNIYNCLAAIGVGLSQGLELAGMASGLSKVLSLPGRIEFIESIDRRQNFKIIVDYAFEPKAMEALYQSLKNNSYKKIIHVLGSAGGGRDKSRRPKLGELAGRNGDIVIVTNEDPYDEDPWEIINQVAAGAAAAGKEENENLFKILDRRQAIAKAINLAGEKDLILITGKGSEQAMAVSGGKKIPWDDREVAREELGKIANRGSQIADRK
ncbi:UDP-N-acetylmuramoyl-L-alanyl-D-glutamate--2,6-diaminopimelate ligase [Candidatus Falkowbacteria bacterium]|nr:UDP-N-acetylmuramoyl-L-alanyl-D-glutamate--2,6-diaminopimelate ligase [Candidatus Falkowbacteria bacterium]